MGSPRRCVLVAVALVIGAPASSSAHWGPGGPPATVRCESRQGRTTYCRTGTRGPVRLQRQLSGSPCIAYDTWGADPDGGGIWVWNGCRAVFVVGGGWGPPPEPDWRPGRGRTVTCASQDFQYNHCRLGPRRHVRLVKNLSNTRCVRGDNWDVDRGGIWVDRGCVGRFVVE